MQNELQKKRHFDAFCIFITSLILFTMYLFHHEFIQFEARFGLFAQEMLRNGISFFPTTYHLPYADYPATSTILIYWISLLTGKLTPFTSVFPSATASALTLSLTYLIGSLHSRIWGFYGVLLSLLTVSFVMAARSVTLDPYPMLATVFCFYLAYSVQCGYSAKRLWFIPLGFILGFAFRGPIGLVVPTAVVCLFYLVECNFKKFIIAAFTSAILLIICMALLLSAARYDGGMSFLNDVVVMQITGRIGQTSHDPFYFYFTQSLSDYAISFPIALCVIAVYAKQLFRTPIDPDKKLLRHLAAWTLIVLIGFTLASIKKIRYLLPMVPPISLIAAYCWIATPTPTLLRYLRKFILYASFCLPLIGIALLGAAYLFSKQRAMPLEIAYFSATLLFTIIAVGNIGIGLRFKQESQRELGFLSSAAFTFIVFYSLAVQPLIVQFNRATPFVEQVLALQNQSQAIAFYKIGPDGEDIKFMVALNQPIKPLFISTEDALLKIKKPTLFIADQAEFFNLSDSVKKKVRLLYRGKLGHQHSVVFTLSPP